MNIYFELQEKEKDTPINVASALIDIYKGRANCGSLQNNYIEDLEAIADHIKVYVQHYRNKMGL